MSNSLAVSRFLMLAEAISNKTAGTFPKISPALTCLKKRESNSNLPTGIKRNCQKIDQKIEAFVRSAADLDIFSLARSAPCIKRTTSNKGSLM